MDYLAEAKKFGGTLVPEKPQDIDYLSAAKEFGGSPVQNKKEVNYLDAAKEFGGTLVAQPKQQGEQEEFVSAQREAAKQPQAPEEKGFISSNIDWAKDALKTGWDSLISSGYGMQMSEAGEFITRLEEKYGKGAENAPPEKKKEYFEAVDLYKKANAGREQLSEERQQRYEKTPQRPATQEFKAAMSGFEKDELSFLDSAAKAGSAFLSNPIGVVADIGLESTPASLATVASALLVRLGFGSGLAVAGAGGSASAITEFGNEYADRRAKGMDHDKAWQDAAVKSGVIGTLDAASMNSAGSAAGKVMEALTGTKRISTAAKEVAKETGKQAALGAAGEAGGSLAIGEMPNPAAVMAEAVGETFGAPLEAVSTYRSTAVDKNKELARAIRGDVASKEFSPEGIQTEAARRMAGKTPVEMETIAKAMEARNAPIAQPETPKSEKPKEEAQPTTFSEDNLTAMGIGKTNKKLREALIGKDLSNPDERAEVQSTLQEYRDRPKLSEGIRTKVDAFLSSPVMTSEISAVTPTAIDQTLTTPKVEAVQVPSLEGDKSEVEMDVGKAYAAGKGVPVASPLGQLNVVALEDQNDNGELFIHDDNGEVVGSVFFTKDEAPDGTRFKPVFTIDKSYRDKEFDAAIYDLMHSLGAVTPKQEEVVTAEPAKVEEAVAEQITAAKPITSMTRNEYQEDQESFGQIPANFIPENFSFTNDKGDLLSVKELINKYGDKAITNLATLYGVKVKDLKRNAEKLLEIQENIKKVEGLTEESLNKMNVKQLQELAKSIGAAKSGNKANLVANILDYEPSITKAFNKRVQNIKHKSAVLKALQNNEEVDPKVLKDYPDFAAYSAPRDSKIYKDAINQLALRSALEPIDSYRVAVKNIEKTLADPNVDPLVAQVEADTLKRMKEIRDKSFGETTFLSIDNSNTSAINTKTTRSPSFKTKIKKINKLLQEGKISEAEHTNRITEAIENDFTKDTITPKARGSLEIRKRLIEAAQAGVLDEEDLGLAEWFIKQNQSLYDDLGISIRKPTKYEQKQSGHYNPLARILTVLKKPNIEGETIIHEFMHHMERMMPVQVQDEITKAWGKKFISAMKQADRGTDKDLQQFFDLLYNYHFTEDLSSTKQMKAAMGMLKDGRVEYEFYQYVNPSEFWAVNAARIVQNRYNFNQGTIKKLRLWLREFSQKLKSLLGFPSDAPIIRALDSLAKADGKFKSESMLSEEGSGEYFMINPEPKRTPTADAQDALDEMEKLGMGAKEAKPGLMKSGIAVLENAVENPSASIRQAKETYTRFVDKVGSSVFSADRALNNNIRRAVIDAGLGHEEILGYLMNVSLSQTYWDDAVANNHIMYGNSRWNEDLLKWEAIDDDEAKMSTIARQIDEMAKAHGLTYDQSKNFAHRAFEARRLQGLQEFNEKIREQMRDNYEQGNIKEANRLRRKLKYIHMNQDIPGQIEYGVGLFKRFPELKGIDKSWNKMRTNAAKVMMDTGLWTEEYTNDLLSVSDYVPFRREMEEEFDKNPQGFLRGLQVQAKERKLKGSDLDVANIFDNMAQWTRFAISRGVRNRSTVALVDALEDFGMAEKVSSPQKATNLVKLWRDGTLEYYSVSDPNFIPTFRGLESVAVPTFKTAAKFSGMLRDSVVMMPLFTIAQVPADAYTAMFSSGLKPQYALRIPFLAVKEFGKTLFNISKTHERLKAVSAVGVKDFMSVTALKNVEIETGLVKEGGITKQILEYAKRGLKNFAMAGDNCVRQAMYEASMQAGLSEAEAMEKAFNVIHFRNMGTNPLLRMAGQTVPFFNSYLAAMDVTVKTITGIGISPQDRMQAFKTFMYMNAAVTTLSILYSIANGDDEDYLKKPTQVRDRLLMIPGTGGLSIPLRKDAFLLPKISAEHLYLLLTNKGFEDGRKMRDSMWSWLSSSLSSPTMVPQVVKPTIEVLLNKDFFMNRDLVPYYQSKMETWRQFNESTSELGKLAGKTGVISPINFDHLIRGYFGSLGGLGLVITNKVFHNDPEVERPEMTFREVLNSIPGTSSFISKPSENSLKTDFYVLQEECNKAALTIKDIENRSPSEIKKALEDEDLVMRAGMASQINKIGKQLGEIRKYIAFVSNAPESQYTAKEKREEIKSMRKLEWEILKDMDVKRLRAMANL